MTAHQTVHLVDIELMAPDGTPDVLRLSHPEIRPFPASDPDAPNCEYDNRLLEIPSYGADLYADPERLTGTAGAGEVVVSNIDGALSRYRDHAWGRIVHRRGIEGAPYASYQIWATGRAAAPRWTLGERARVSIPYWDRRGALDKGVSGRTFSGTNIGPAGYESTPDALGGSGLPTAWGDLSTAHVPAVWANEQSATVCLHDGAIQSVVGLYDRGAPMALSADPDLTGAAFDAYAPGVGRFGTDLTRGLVRLGIGAGQGAVTVGLLGGPVPGWTASGPGLAAALLQRAGEPVGPSLTALATALPAPMGLWCPGRYDQAISELARGWGGWCIPDRLGIWQAGRLSLPTAEPADVLTEDGIKSLEIDDPVVSTPAWQVTVRWGRVYQTFGRDQVAGELRGTSAETALAQEWRTATASDALTRSRYPDAKTLTIDTALRNQPDAEALAWHLLMLFGRRPNGSLPLSLKAEVELTDERLLWSLGQPVRLYCPADGLDCWATVIGLRWHSPSEQAMTVRMLA